MHAPDFHRNFFELFDLPVNFRLDTAELARRYRALQNEMHPDRFADRPETERRLSMQWATRINEAYQTLGRPVLRGRYLLSLRGVDTEEETNTAMPPEFLIEQMEWREAVEEARNARDDAALQVLDGKLRQQMRTLESALAVKIDDLADYPAAAGEVRKLRFMEKLAEEIASAFDQLDN